jgi:rSAM/selenodomain-associated transferase 1
VSQAPTRAIIVFARQPRAGRVKTRLWPDLGACGATEVYRRLLDRTLEIVDRTAGLDRCLYAAERDELGYFERRLTAAWRVELQSRGDLGARMHSALNQLLTKVSCACLIGSDCADFSSSDLSAAFDALAHGSDVVLGPTADGGYWLIGLRVDREALFRDVPWGTDRVFRQTVAAIDRAGLTAHYLPVRHDVDRVEDLAYLPSGVAQKMS